MSSIHNAPLFQLTYDLLKDLHSARCKFEKSEKYSLGGMLENAILELLLSIIDAGHAKREWKITSIDKALQSGEKAKILIRLSFDLKQINERRYLNWQESLNKTGRMLGGWRKSL